MSEVMFTSRNFNISKTVLLLNDSEKGGFSAGSVERSLVQSTIVCIKVSDIFH